MPLTIKVQGQDVMVAEEFVYLGSLIHINRKPTSSSTGRNCDISRRSAITRATMQSLENKIWRSRLAISTKLKLYNECTYQYSCMVRTAGRYLRRTHSRSMHSTSDVCICCLASNGTNLYGMMMYEG